jgi:hypothetical protein
MAPAKPIVNTTREIIFFIMNFFIQVREKVFGKVAITEQTGHDIFGHEHEPLVRGTSHRSQTRITRIQVTKNPWKNPWASSLCNQQINFQARGHGFIASFSVL